AAVVGQGAGRSASQGRAGGGDFQYRGADLCERVYGSAGGITIGQSYYPNYHGTMENFRDTPRESIERYHKDVMVVETAYPSRPGRGPAPAAGVRMRIRYSMPAGRR